MKSRLENWYIINNIAFGDIHNDSRFAEGERVRTSNVLRQVGDILETENSLYLLGKPLEHTNGIST
jgi:hypothetical protein